MKESLSTTNIMAREFFGQMGTKMKDNGLMTKERAKEIKHY